jgi:hypothetical protein
MKDLKNLTDLKYYPIWLQIVMLPQKCNLPYLQNVILHGYKM